MATTGCKNCFNSNQRKLNLAFESCEGRRQDLVVFILNIILNIEKYFIRYCTCKDEKICLVCETAIFFKDMQFGIYKYSLNFDKMSKMRIDLQSKLNELCKKNNHFV